MSETQELLTPVPQKSGQSFGVWKALGFMFLGMLLTITLALSFFLLFTGAPQTGQPLPQPAPSGKPDLTATVSQEYINREVATSLEKNPISILGVADLKQVEIEFLPDSAISVTAR